MIQQSEPYKDNGGGEEHGDGEREDLLHLAHAEVIATRLVTMDLAQRQQGNDADRDH